MIDNLQIKVACTNSEYNDLCSNRLKVDMPINSDKIKFDHENLRYGYYPNSNTLTVTNSVHKYFNSQLNDSIGFPTNHNDYTFLDFLVTIDFLSESILCKPLDELKISSRFEFGLNVDTDIYHPFNIINKYQSFTSTHINEFFTVEPKKGKPIQRNCCLSDWYIKGYDKTRQADFQINSNILRFEVVVNELRKLRQILNLQEITVADIATLDSWNKMFGFLIDTYDNIRKIPEMQNTPLSVDDINSIYSYCNKLKRYDIQQSTTRYYFEKLNKQFETVYNKYNSCESNYHNVIRKRLIETYCRLVGYPESVKLQLL